MVPQGREISPLLTVLENLKSGFAPLQRGDRNIPSHVFEVFAVLRQMPSRRGGDLCGDQRQLATRAGAGDAVEAAHAVAGLAMQNRFLVRTPRSLRIMHH